MNKHEQMDLPLGNKKEKKCTVEDVIEVLMTNDEKIREYTRKAMDEEGSVAPSELVKRIIRLAAIDFGIEPEKLEEELEDNKRDYAYILGPRYRQEFSLYKSEKEEGEKNLI